MIAWLKHLFQLKRKHCAKYSPQQTDKHAAVESRKRELDERLDYLEAQIEAYRRLERKRDAS
jgi:hypothetical protein